MADGRHFEKTDKSPYLSNRLIDFDEIWHTGADWPRTGGRSLKFPIFQKTKITISQQWIDRSSRNLARLCKMCFLTVQRVENLNFQNPRWRTTAILKTVKSPYLRNSLTDVDEIWHSDADWPPTGDRPSKISNFSKTKMAAAAILKNHKNRDITAADWQILAKFGTIMQNWSLNRPDRQKIRISKIQDGGRPPI